MNIERDREWLIRNSKRKALPKRMKERFSTFEEAKSYLSDDKVYADLISANVPQKSDSRYFKYFNTMKTKDVAKIKEVYEVNYNYDYDTLMLSDIYNF